MTRKKGGSLTFPSDPLAAMRELSELDTPRAAPAQKENEDHKNNTILQTDKPTNLPTDKQADKPTVNKPTVKRTSKPVALAAPEPEPPAPVRRADGRTLRPRQETADRTMVTSLRLAVSTVEALDEHCWQHRQRKQDVVQAALDMYFAAMAEDE